MDTILLNITDINGTVFSSSDCTTFNFEKEYYTPYSSLYCTFFFDDPIINPTEISFYINSNLIHHGLIDSIQSQKANPDKFTVKIISKGFTSLLTQNQLEPGIKSDISLNSLMDSFITIPYVTHENNSNSQNYIYVKDNSSMWDAIANLAYKLNGSYPFIEGTNNVRITQKSSPQNILISNDNMLSYGIVNNYSKIISDFHMQDIEGNYNTYNLSNQDANAKNIVRHKHFDLDQQYLYNPSDALNFRLNYSMRAFFSYYAEYQGYNGEDLSDTLTIDSIISNARINKLQVKGNSKGITTKCYAYYDNFCNV